MSKAGLYIHFPFCRRACFYCHFFKKKHRAELADDYVDGLKREMRLRRDPGLACDTVYFGGGSPSLMSARQVAGLLGNAAKNFNLSGRAEITLEANPEDLSLALLKEYRAAGVNRLSVGAQSFQERDLRFLQRTHGAAQARQAVVMARDAGIANVSIDLIIGLPTQTAKSVGDNFKVVKTIVPSHVSLYILENVPHPAAEGRDDRDARLYFQACQALLAIGFEHYEVSNFCRPGKASRHNLKYWRMKPYLGLGPSAAGFMGGVDTRNCSDLNHYRAAAASGRLPLVKTRQMDPGKRRLITGLRLLAGLPASAFAGFADNTDFLLREGFLIRRGGTIAVPPDKILLLNEILGYFI